MAINMVRRLFRGRRIFFMGQCCAKALVRIFSDLQAMQPIRLPCMKRAGAISSALIINFQETVF